MRKLQHLLLTLLTAMSMSGILKGQSVGLVLSGGGAAGLAHIGVIRALEENHIPIDYITGTSMGAFIGGLYAAGYSVDEITQIVQSPEFLLAIEGELSENDIYYFSHELRDASLIRLNFSPKNLIRNSIPTNLVTPNTMDYMLLNLFGTSASVAHYNFDSLMVPFRCVAADIVKKQEVIFDKGSLALAIRASTTYPFYYKPVVIDSTLLFDGGLYNNFPADVMYADFMPDVIIGSNVASQVAPPNEDDLLSLVRNMITSPRDFTIDCEEGYILEPKSDVGVFDFSNIPKEIELGYQTALNHMDQLLALTGKAHRTEAELDSMRTRFKEDFPNQEIGEITITGDLNKKQKQYIRSMVGPEKADSLFTFKKFKSQYLRISQDPKLKYVEPSSKFNDATGKYDLNLRIGREKDLTLYFGGNFSSRPINTGYVAAKYDFFGRSAVSLMANSYFGKFYGSAMLRSDIDFGGKKRMKFSPYVILNRWDYFRSFATFFELSRPSYIVKNETFGGIEYTAAMHNNGVFLSGIQYGETLDRYYQSDNFTVEDTADFTQFRMGTASFGIDRNSLNRKQYASNGTRFEIYLQGITGEETTEYGTTAKAEESYEKQHTWATLNLRYQNYFSSLGPVRFGFSVEGVASNKPFYENYNATIISTPAFSPIPESKTFFLNDLRTTLYASLGLQAIWNIRKNIDFRLEGYAFQPGRRILADANNEAYYSYSHLEQYYIGSGVLVYHSPLGPVSLNLNYYDRRTEGPWSFSFNFGYTIFNQSVYK